ncbi:MAG: TraB/GumN family protein [Halobacteriovoraceae bacterium]|jgi:uncharacterized protein YbaP (TraB family)|nr:TraB/GumN family protein [Halobacteriovoraceae bacterium]MBT5093154.1 TraB/GumN family protein [Halobacteriovoraceae bacterium]
MKILGFILAFMVLQSCSTVKIQDPYFWEIKKGKKISYLLGSFHMMISPEELPKYIIEKFDDSPHIILEVAPQDSHNVAESFKEHLSQSTGKDLKKQLGPVAWRGFVKRIIEWDSDPEVTEDYLAALTPKEIYRAYQKVINRWVEETIEKGLKNNQVFPNQVRYFNALFSTEKSYLDRYFGERAADQNKFTSSLDNLYEANQIINNYAFEQFNHKVVGQIELITIVEAFERTVKNVKEAVGMVEQYRAGTWPFKIYVGDLSPKLKKVYQTQLIGKRNRIWWPRIVKHLNEGGGNFIVVGLGHMTGKYSLLKLMRKNGFVVTRMDSRYFRKLDKTPQVVTPGK